MIRAAFNLTELPFSKEIKTQQLFMHTQFVGILTVTSVFHSPSS
jgi:hypothetical protein